MSPSPSLSQGTRTTITSPRETKGFPCLPTPTPTNASVISDEDAAFQLTRLRDPLATPLLSPSIIDEDKEPPPPDAPAVVADHALGEEAAGEKPVREGGVVGDEHSRCTRCIGAKKGCDRRRPCGRCDAQGFESGCCSDDEVGTARRKVAVLRRSSMIGRSVLSKSKRGRGR